MYSNSTTTGKNSVIISNELFQISLFLSSRKKRIKEEKSEDIFHLQTHFLKINLQPRGKDLHEERMEGAFFVENTIIMLIIVSKIIETSIIKRIKNYKK